MLTPGAGPQHQLSASPLLTREVWSACSSQGSPDHLQQLGWVLPTRASPKLSLCPFLGAQDGTPLTPSTQPLSLPGCLPPAAPPSCHGQHPPPNAPVLPTAGPGWEGPRVLSMSPYLPVTLPAASMPASPRHPALELTPSPFSPWAPPAARGDPDAPHCSQGGECQPSCVAGPMTPVSEPVPH